MNNIIHLGLRCPFVKQIKNVLEQFDQNKAIVVALIKDAEKEGRRIVNSDDQMIKDYHSGEVIGRFPSNIDDWPDTWHHIDPISDQADLRTPPLVMVEGLPASLITALEDWVGGNEDEARAWIGDQK